MKYDKNSLKIGIRKDLNIKFAKYNAYIFSKYSIIILWLIPKPKNPPLLDPKLWKSWRGPSLIIPNILI